MDGKRLSEEILSKVQNLSPVFQQFAEED